MKTIYTRQRSGWHNVTLLILLCTYLRRKVHKDLLLNHQGNHGIFIITILALTCYNPVHISLLNFWMEFYVTILHFNTILGWGQHKPMEWILKEYIWDKWKTSTYTDYRYTPYRFNVFSNSWYHKECLNKQNIVLSQYVITRQMIFAILD